MTLYYTGTANAFNTTLSGNIGASDNSIALTTAATLQAPGVLVIDRVNSNNIATPLIREYVSFTGISNNTLTGVTRGLGGSTGQAHGSGGVVEECISVSHWNGVIAALLNVLTSSGSIDVTKVIDLGSVQTLVNKTLTAPTINTPTITNPTVTGETNTKPTINGSVPNISAYSPGSGSTVTLDLSNSNVHFVNMPAGNVTIALNNITTNQPFIIRILQDGGGSRTVTWFSTIKWAGGTAPTLTTVASKADTFGFICTSTGNYDGYIIGQNL